MILLGYTSPIYGENIMKLAIIGSRGLYIDDLSPYVPQNATEIISGGAKGIDRCAEKYAEKNGLKLTVFWPDYKKYKRGAPLIRNQKIIETADEVIAFWDGESRGTKHVIDLCRKINKKVSVYIIKK